MDRLEAKDMLRRVIARWPDPPMDEAGAAVWLEELESRSRRPSLHAFADLAESYSVRPSLNDFITAYRRVLTEPGNDLAPKPHPGRPLDPEAAKAAISAARAILENAGREASR